MIFLTFALALHLSVKVQTATRFRAVQQNGVSWLQGPDGSRFFSLGVCCVDTGEGFDRFNPSNPGYAAFQYYRDRADWATDVTHRLNRWGFNTIGAWSDNEALRKPSEPDLKFTPILHMGSAAGAPWRDMWDPAIVKVMNDVAASGIASLGGKDRRVIGYFSDNELGWWNAALFDWAWKGKYSRRILVSLLIARYHGWPNLRQDFLPIGAKSFDQLTKSGRLYLRPGRNGIGTVHAYISALSSRYYELCRTAIKKNDPGALYLGDRYISGFYPEVAESAGKWCDVVSTNLNADWNDGSFAPFYLPALTRIVKKPILITEYYMAAKQNRSGNKNDSSGFPVVDTQAERAQGFLNSTKALLQTPSVVGAHWFQYYDEPKNGRDDGENYNMGLVDIHNLPYEEMIAASQSLDLVSEHAKAQFQIQRQREIPEISPEAVSDLGLWPRDAALLSLTSGDPRGDAFAVTCKGNLYVAVHWNEDRFFEAFYKDGKIPPSDEPLLRIDGLRKSVVVRLPDSHPIVKGAELIRWIPGVRSTAILKLTMPATSAQIKVRMDTRGRAYRMLWTATVRG
jgi:hypothetical protein